MSLRSPHFAPVYTGDRAHTEPLFTKKSKTSASTAAYTPYTQSELARIRAMQVTAAQKKKTQQQQQQQQQQQIETRGLKQAQAFDDDASMMTASTTSSSSTKSLFRGMLQRKSKV